MTTEQLIDEMIQERLRRRQAVYKLDERGGYRFVRWLQLDAQIRVLRALRRRFLQQAEMAADGRIESRRSES